MLIQIAICDECGHKWLTEVTPKQCAKCKSRKWNGTKSTSTVKEVPTEIRTGMEQVGNPPPELYGLHSALGTEIELPATGPFMNLPRKDWPKPVAELADGEPYRITDRGPSTLAEDMKTGNMPRGASRLTERKKSPYCRHGLAFHPGCS